MSPDPSADSSTPTVGVDVGGTFVKAILWSHGVARRGQRRTPDTVEGMLEVVEETAESLGPGLPVGVGLAGLVDHRRGVLVWAPHLPGEEVEVRGVLEERLGVPVQVDNDANFAAVAEHRVGIAVGRDPVMMITLGTGIGMGMIARGKLFHGQAYAGEVGHITVEPNGEPCACGRRGCWETKVSGSRLEADAAVALGAGSTANDLVDAAYRGHREAAGRLAEAGEWLARGIETLVLALDPQLVVVGGAAAQAGDLLLAPVRRRLAHTEGSRHRDSTVVAGILGPDAGAIGAAIAAEETFR